MTFDPQAYAALQASNPAAAASYLAAFTAPAAAPALSQQPQAAPQPQPGNGYSNPAAATPPPVLARGTLEDFYNQPTGGSAPSVTSKFFNKRPQGSWLQLEVLRDVTNADVRQQQTPQGQPQTFRDGRAKFVLVVNVRVTGSSDNSHTSEFPDGEGTIWVKGILADELRRAMTAAGDASGYPKGGAQIVMVSAGEKASRTPGFNATKLYQLQYGAPALVGGTPVPPTSPVSVPSAAPIPDAPVPVSATVPTTPVGPAEVPVPAFQAPPAAPVAVPDISGDRAALLARLQGQG